MTLQDSLDWLFASQQFGIKLGLENTFRLLEACGRPDRRIRVIHVAGTNGKGSTCAMADAILRRAGFRTGLYTSPHLVDFRERIRVDGAMIPEAAAASGLADLRLACAGWEHSPTFFEISTVLAMKYFADSQCDYVVLETGMGGRLDATNAASPIVSVIAPIALDHSEWLGNTIELIAAEKSGIIKPGIPVVSAPQRPEAAGVLAARAEQVGAGLEFVSSPWEGPVALAGPHQHWNAALAVAAVRASGAAISSDVISAALAGVEWPARFQEVAPGIIVDGGHNPHAAAALVSTWQAVFPAEKATVVFGALGDKDFPAVLQALEPIAEEFLFVPIDNPRAADPGRFPPHVGAPSQCFDSLAAALAAAARSPRKTLITGSLFLAGETLARLGKSPARS